MTTALGVRGITAGEPPGIRRSRLSNRRQRPSVFEFQRAQNSPCAAVPNGMSHSSPIARHCMPQKQTRQIAMTALRRADSDQRRLWPGSHRPGAILCHSREFGQHFVHEHVNIGKRIPRARRGFCRTDGGSHVLTSTLLRTVIGLDGRLAGHRHTIQLTVVIEVAPNGSGYLQTDSKPAARVPLDPGGAFCLKRNRDGLCITKISLTAGECRINDPGTMKEAL